MKEYHTVPYLVYTYFFTKNCPKYFDEIYVPLETYGLWSSYAFIIPKHKYPFSTNKCWTKSLILCWCLIFGKILGRH